MRTNEVERPPALAIIGALLVVAFVLLIIGRMFFLTAVVPDAGFEAVLIKKPWFFGHGGVDPNPIKTGRSYVAASTDHVMIDMRPHIKHIDIKDMMTSNGVPIDFDAVIRLQAVDSVKLYTQFGVDWYRINIEPQFRRVVRDAVKKHGMNEVAITAAAGDEIDAEVEREMRKYFALIKIPVALLDVTLGRANPPDAVRTQREETARMEQLINTQEKAKLAQDSRRAAELSRAAADNAYREAMQLSPDQFLQLEKIKMFPQVCGGGKCTVFVGGQGGPVPVFDTQR